ncbi:acetyltransferase [Caballeronia sp. LZ035]|uniref:acetyltransferase n=1 Tax=Caballeronia sp. LZ035 TaxID=3038568 RepID=UPI00286013B2|nr:acetyltransferase [Caballeronia sp. LZ035]MDR5756699.1 acetyltransferase [Caballeronia sp. LZ035]
MNDLIIFGATSLARLARYHAEQDMGLNVHAFAVDRDYLTGDEFASLPVIEWQEAMRRFPAHEVSVFVAIGYRNMRARQAAYQRIRQSGYAMTNIVASSAYVAKDVVMGDNNIVMPGVVIEPGVTIGSNNVLWSNATICHDTVIGHHNFIAANTTLGGGVSLGERNFIGFSSVVLQGRRIGDETLIGAQSLIHHDTADLSLYYGSPAKRIRALDADVGVVVADA